MVSSSRGKRFGRLVALEPTEERDKSSETVIWRCKCDCGNTKNISSYLLTSGRVRSCGCLQSWGMIYSTAEGNRML